MRDCINTNNQDGGVLVEAAISLTLLLILLMGSVNLERAITSAQILTQVARSTARAVVSKEIPGEILSPNDEALQDHTPEEILALWFCEQTNISGRLVLEESGLNPNDYKYLTSFETFSEDPTIKQLLTVHIQPNVSDTDLARASFLIDYNLPILPPCAANN